MKFFSHNIKIKSSFVTILTLDLSNRQPMQYYSSYYFIIIIIQYWHYSISKNITNDISHHFDSIIDYFIVLLTVVYWYFGKMLLAT
jgi:hypothetical protein